MVRSAVEAESEWNFVFHFGLAEGLSRPSWTIFSGWYNKLNWDNFANVLIWQEKYLKFQSTSCKSLVSINHHPAFCIHPRPWHLQNQKYQYYLLVNVKNGIIHSSLLAVYSIIPLLANLKQFYCHSPHPNENYKSKVIRHKGSQFI